MPLFKIAIFGGGARSSQRRPERIGSLPRMLVVLIGIMCSAAAFAAGQGGRDTKGGYHGPAQLPLVTVPSAMADSPAPGPVISVNAGADLQAALDSALCGDTIHLQAGVTFSGQFFVPARNCDDKHWIIIRTSSPDSALPAEGHRLTPCYAGVNSLEGRPNYNCPNPTNVLSKVEMTAPGHGPFIVAKGANFYRFIGLEITRSPGIKGPGVLMSLGGTADHIILDRSWLHGQAQDETEDGFSLNGGTYMAVIDSYFNDFHCISNIGTCSDAHGVAGGNSQTQDGPYLIQNNFLEASGEAIMFGGGPATKSPADIEIIGNHFWKPWQWMPGNSPFKSLVDDACTVALHRLHIQTLPQIPASDGPVRHPRFGDLVHHFGLRPLSFLVVFFHRGLHAIIARGQYVRTAEGEHQEHVRSPNANALDLRQVGNDLVFCHFRHALEFQKAGLRLLREVAQVGRLLA